MNSVNLVTKVNILLVYVLLGIIIIEYSFYQNYLALDSLVLTLLSISVSFKAAFNYVNFN